MYPEPACLSSFKWLKATRKSSNPGKSSGASAILFGIGAPTLVAAVTNVSSSLAISRP